MKKTRGWRKSNECERSWAITADGRLVPMHLHKSIILRSTSICIDNSLLRLLSSSLYSLFLWKKKSNCCMHPTDFRTGTIIITMIPSGELLLMLIWWRFSQKWFDLFTRPILKSDINAENKFLRGKLKSMNSWIDIEMCMHLSSFWSCASFSSHLQNGLR